MASECTRFRCRGIVADTGVDDVARTMRLPVAIKISIGYSERAQCAVLLINTFSSGGKRVRLLRTMGEVITRKGSVLYCLINPSINFVPGYRGCVRSGNLSGGMGVISCARRIISCCTLTSIILIYSAFRAFNEITMRTRGYKLPLVLSSIKTGPRHVRSKIGKLLCRGKGVTRLTRGVRVLQSRGIEGVLSGGVSSVTVRRGCNVSGFTSDFYALLNL